jgi:hypothetical protein
MVVGDTVLADWREFDGWTFNAVLCWIMALIMEVWALDIAVLIALCALEIAVVIAA